MVSAQSTIRRTCNFQKYGINFFYFYPSFFYGKTKSFTKVFFHCSYEAQVEFFDNKVRKSPLRGVCHEIFDLQFFHYLNPFGPDKQANVFLNLVSISSRYLITKLSPQCANLQIFSFMIDVFTHKRISPDCLFKSNYREVKILILILQCAIYLRGMLHTAEIISTVGCTPRRSSPQWVAHRGDHLLGGLHTAEIISAVYCTLPRSSLRCVAHL